MSSSTHSVVGSSIQGVDGWRHLHFDSVGSTNVEAMRLANDGDPGQLWVTASEQTAGKARRGRDWVSDRGNLYASCVLIDAAPDGALANLPLVTAVALHRAVLACGPVREDQLKIKWPNDVLLDGRKLSGILLESSVDTLGRQIVVVGCGVNCAHSPDNPLYPATSLGGAGIDISPEVFFQYFAKAMAAVLQTWNRGEGFDAIRRDWLARAKGIGETVVARFDDGEVSGVFQEMDKDGRLVLVEPNGTEHRISAADIFFGTSAALRA